jgi:dihydrofolate reductase
MGKVIFDISMSLDGFITGPDPSPENPLGTGGIRLHDWWYADKRDADARVIDEMMQTTGAMIASRRVYDESRWGERDPWGNPPGTHVPVFVISHDVPEGMDDAGPVYTFVTDGLESALKQARAKASDKNVYVIGGANIAGQYLKAGSIDEIRIHLVPVLLGAGVRLFDHQIDQHIDLQTTRVIESKSAIHLSFRIIK